MTSKGSQLKIAVAEDGQFGNPEQGEHLLLEAATEQWLR